MVNDILRIWKIAKRKYRCDCRFSRRKFCRNARFSCQSNFVSNVIEYFNNEKADVLLEEKYPDYFISKYAMVTFHRLPYAVAKQRGQIQDKILMELCSKITTIEELNLENAISKIKDEFRRNGIEEKIQLND